MIPSMPVRTTPQPPRGLRWRSPGSLLTLLCLLLTLAGQDAAAQKTFAARYTNTAVAGDIVLIGNVNYHCTTAAPATAAQITACNNARTGGSITNNNTYMVPVDTDSDPATSNSSSAGLNLPAGSNVLFAGLYLNGISASATNRAAATFATPLAGGAPVTALAANVAAVGSNYQSFIDVTTLVQAGGNGVYTVGNVASTAGAGNWGGWTMVVAYRNTSLATRNLAVFDGLQQLGVTTVLSFLIGSALGLYSAWRRGTWLANILPPLALFVNAMPYFWFALLLIYFLALKRDVFPISGNLDPFVGDAFTPKWWTSMLRHAALPAITIVVTAAGGWLITMRNNVMSVLGEDYLAFARAKGLSERRIVNRYVLRNAMLPSLTAFGMALGFVVGGSILVETVFSYPGLGFYLFTSVNAKDYPLMQALFLMIAAAVLIANFLVDLLYAVLDPRVRDGRPA